MLLGRGHFHMSNEIKLGDIVKIYLQSNNYLSKTKTDKAILANVIGIAKWNNELFLIGWIDKPIFIDVNKRPNDFLLSAKDWRYNIGHQRYRYSASIHKSNIIKE
jgi:hypothetical protein